jgi:hypothetical protein
MCCINAFGCRSVYTHLQGTGEPRCGLVLNVADRDAADARVYVVCLALSQRPAAQLRHGFVVTHALASEILALHARLRRSATVAVDRRSKACTPEGVLMITQERLKELFNLDPATGVLYWKEPTSPRINVGDVAGTASLDGYWQVGIDRKLYRRSRLVFLFVTGCLPEKVDHRNRVRDDDRPCNLRAATGSQNEANKAACSRVGLPKGVKRLSRRTPFQARIQVDGKSVHLGSFATPELAHAAYREAATKHFGEFARFE